MGAEGVLPTLSNTVNLYDFTIFFLKLHLSIKLKVEFN